MNRKIKLSILLFLSIIFILTIKSKAAYKSTDPTVTSGQNFTITVTSTTNLQNFDLKLSSYSGLTFLGCSNGSDAAVVNGGNISYATAGSGTTMLGTYSFKAPEVSQKTTFKVVFNINDTTNTSVVTVNPSSGSSSQEENPTPTTTTKSNVATLKNLGIRPNDFSGFKANTLTYNTTVPYETEKVEVYATKGYDKQTITGTGTKKLNVGANKVEVVVTAEDGTTKKTYTINITRKEKDDNTADEEPEETDEPEEEPTEENTVGFGLSELTISGLDLNPEFQTDIYEYRIELKEDLDKLDLSTLATEVGSEIEIIGNGNLKEGENIITIMVKSEDGEKNATYQIIVNKKIEDAKIDEPKDMKTIIIIGCVVGGILLLIIMTIIIKKKRIRKLNEEDEDFNHYNDININDLYKESIQSTFDEDDDFPIKKKNSKGKRFK